MFNTFIDRMINIYGFENAIVLDFINFVERLPHTQDSANIVETLVSSHELFPVFDN